MSSLSEVLRTRRTEKVLADPGKPLPSTSGHRQALDTLLADAAWAPYHYPADKTHREGEHESPVPWRFYKVDTPACRQLMHLLQAPDSGAGKITAMLAGADALVQVTWLPDPPAEALAPGQSFAGTQRNVEHIAAAAAAVQSLLLLATEQGYRTYWSSGGVLRNANVFEWLKIPNDQLLLGSVFLFPQDIGDAQIKPGAWRDKRGAVDNWSAWREVSS